jgi:hypothetical protein
MRYALLSYICMIGFYYCLKMEIHTSVTAAAVECT